MISMPQKMPTKPMMEPDDRSMPPVRMTSDAPIETTATQLDWEIMF